MYWTNTPRVPSSLEIAREIVPRFQPRDRILDLGCGPGRTLAGLRAAGLGSRHVGLDTNAPSLLAAAGVGLPVVRADLAALPVADAAFDVGILQAVLTTIVGPELRLAVLREARRTCGRLLYIGDFLQNWELPYYRTRYETGLVETGELGSFVVRDQGQTLYEAHHFTLEELSELLEQAGFAVTQAVFPSVRTRSGNVVRGVSLAAVPL